MPSTDASNRSGMTRTAGVEKQKRGPVIPSRKAEPVLGGRTEPLEARRHDLEGGDATSSRLGASCFCPSGEESGCGMKSWIRVVAGPRASLTTIEIASWATAEKVGRTRVLSATGCPLAQSKLVSEPLAKRIRAWGSSESPTDRSGS